jgi:hypothetical protein
MPDKSGCFSRLHFALPLFIWSSAKNEFKSGSISKESSSSFGGLHGQEDMVGKCESINVYFLYSTFCKQLTQFRQIREQPKRDKLLH